MAVEHEASSPKRSLAQAHQRGDVDPLEDRVDCDAVAVVDPDLLGSCPKELIAANGMDAFTQLLESYVSLRASPYTDALAASGMQAFQEGFWPAWTPGDPLAQKGYARLAYASLCSGITLAQSGL